MHRDRNAVTSTTYRLLQAAGSDAASRFQRGFSAASALFLIVGTGMAVGRSLKWRVLWMFTAVHRRDGVAAGSRAGGRRSRISDRNFLAASPRA